MRSPLDNGKTVRLYYASNNKNVPLYSILFPRAELRLLAAKCAEINLYIDFEKRTRQYARSLAHTHTVVSLKLNIRDKGSHF